MDPLPENEGLQKELDAANTTNQNLQQRIRELEHELATQKLSTIKIERIDESSFPETSNAAGTAMEVQNSQEPERTDHPLLSNYEIYMMQFPCIDRPDVMSTKRVFRRSTFRRGISLENIFMGSPTFLYIEDRFIWVHSKDDVQHTLAFSPTLIYDPKTKMWNDNAEFAPFYGQVVELLYARGGFIYYAGQYKCHDMRNYSGNGFNMLNEKLASSFVDLTLSQDPQARHADSKHREEVTQLYRSGEFRVDTLGLQCVGFNYRIYQILSSSFIKHDAELKRQVKHGKVEMRKMKQQSRKRKREMHNAMEDV
ncbi:hypothetical protein BDQ12DRAFT_691342 [Crucibulum laeve]|uniref:DUF6697 domain-containing protein n=1 Tax=Crucibulum laeve TaxID=68775 RepID=A0A5C3LK58_9AGAR|nr:hypothetical protein BDQ12DRAFT_691342 [Crucibulum laeve]